MARRPTGAQLICGSAVLAMLELGACTAAPTGTPPAAATQPGVARAPADPLPSWNDGPTKQSIVGFVRAVATNGSPDFVAVPERIATFDNDGTLWAEQPLYFQFLFAMDRIRAMAPDHPEWKTKEPYASVLAGDTTRALAGGEQAVTALLLATHTGMTIEDFNAIVKAWIQSARHPVTHRRYDQMIYQPMLEVLAYLRDNGFKTFIVSGGGTEFMRPWVDAAYGIPPEQVVGTRGKLKYEVKDGTPSLFKLPQPELIDDGPGKPVGIAQMIGRRPIAAFGNSDGDFQMLEYTTAGSGRRLGVIVHHTDADREWAYDRGSPIGRLERGLDEAASHGWVLADMKQDWNVIYPAQ